jgi:hypothetical protein
MLKGKIMEKRTILENGNELIRKEFDCGLWEEIEKTPMGRVVKCENSAGYWETTEFDEKSQTVRKENSEGHWETKKWDEKNRFIEFENSTGYWEKIKYDDVLGSAVRTDSNGCEEFVLMGIKVNVANPEMKTRKQELLDFLARGREEWPLSGNDLELLEEIEFLIDQQ